MKLNDIKSVEKSEDIILLKKREIIKHTKEELINSIDSLSKEKKENINIEGNKEIKVSRINKKKQIDGLKKDWFYNKNINLYKKILNSSSIFKLKNLKNRFKFKKINSLNKKINYYNSAIIFSLVLILIIADKYYIEHLIKSGITKLENIKYSKNINEIKQNISNSRLDFTIAYYAFIPFSIIPNNEIQNASKIIKIGKETTFLLDNSISSYLNTLKYIENKNNHDGITGLLDQEKENISKIAENIHIIKTNINKLETNGKLKQYKEKLTILNNYISITDNLLSTIVDNYQSFLNILGKVKTKNYMILFQNNDEIRATGGFIGSAGIVKINKGNIINFEKKDIYALEWEINKNYKSKINPPKGINEITSSFGLRDSNYFADFKKSANSINFFMNKSKYKIDGIIFINMIPILNFLKETDGVFFEKIQKNIDEKNFAEIMSFLVEAKKYKKGTLGSPKQILFDFIVELTQRIKKEKDYINNFNIIHKAIVNRELVFILFNKNSNKIIEKLGLDGVMDYDKYVDYNYPIYTSIGGNKTDRYITRSYKKNIKINENCRIDSMLDITLHHNFTDIDKTRITNLFSEYNIPYSNDLLNISGGGVNKSFLRIQIPKEAIFFPKEGQQLKKEDNYSIIELNTITESGKSSNYNISYYIENKECNKYNYLFVKQPGLYPYNLDLNVNNETIKEIGIDGDYIYNK